MIRDLCHVVPCLLISAVIAAACSSSHSMGDDAGRPDGGPRTGDGGGGTCDCCGVTVGISPGESCFGGVCDPYCGFVRDAGTDSGTPLRCGPGRAIDLACDVDVVRADTPTTISVLVGGRDECFCGESIECRARVSGAFAVELETAVCSDGLLCDACYPFIEGTCALPALEAGRWRVDVNGDPGFELSVLEPGVVPERGEMCVRRGERLDVCAPIWPAVPNTADSACAQANVLGGTRVPIEVTETCGSACDAIGPCTVSIFDDVIRVTPSLLTPSCDIACPEVCELHTELCYTPPLPEGTWRVFLEGYDTPLFTITSSDFGGGDDMRCGGAASGG
jgi:hypothetical protein